MNPFEHELAPYFAAVIANGWVIWVFAVEYIRGIQSDIARANYKINIGQQFDEIVAEDEEQEIKTIIDRRWNT